MTVRGPGWGTHLDEDEPVVEQRRLRPRTCTARTSHWCSIHGTCTCTTTNPYGTRVWDDTPHDDCPLHSPTSDHPRARKVRILKRRPT